MAAPSYRPVGNFVPHEEDTRPILESPEMTSRPWRASPGPNPHPGFEMQENLRPDFPRASQISFASGGNDPTLKPNMTESSMQ